MPKCPTCGADRPDIPNVIYLVVDSDGDRYVYDTMEKAREHNRIKPQYAPHTIVRYVRADNPKPARKKARAK